MKAMRILVINSGSSSLKFQLLETNGQTVLAKGVIERIGEENAQITFRAGDKTLNGQRPIGNHNRAIEMVLTFLLDGAAGVLKCLEEIDAVGHRVVHGGETFRQAVRIDEKVLAQIEAYSALAPLHNPANLAGITACARVMPGVAQVAVFDTAFHHTIKPAAYLYGLPYEYYTRHQVRRYGFHGTSHRYVCHQAAEFLRRPLDSLKMISCHLGNGASLAAVENGRVVDTSMGFTPLEGLMMGTRAGSFDPAVVLYLMKKEKLSPSEMDYILNKKSGLLGVSGLSNDFRDLEKAIACGHERAILARDMYIHRVRKQIGAYIAVLGGLDVLIFTAGVGENAINIRWAIGADMDYLGIAIDAEKNKCRGKLADISEAGSRVTVLVVPTDEEAAIAQETEQVLLQSAVH